MDFSKLTPRERLAPEQAVETLRSLDLAAGVRRTPVAHDAGRRRRLPDNS